MRVEACIDDAADGKATVGEDEGASSPPSGDSSHSTAMPSTEPMPPVVTSRFRPIATGGSLRSHTALPISDGWRHVRSCAGKGAGGYARSR